MLRPLVVRALGAVVSLVVAFSGVFYGLNHGTIDKNITNTFFSSPRDYTRLIYREAGGNGSAVMIAPGLAVTAAHVADVANLKIEGKPVHVIALDRQVDVAIVSVPGVDCPCAPIADLSPEVDDPINVVGFPVYSSVRTQYRTSGEMMGIHPETGAMMLNALVSFGNSGGGIFNTRGELVGLLTAGAAANMGYFAIPVWHLSLGVSHKQLKEFTQKYI